MAADARPIDPLPTRIDADGTLVRTIDGAGFLKSLSRGGLVRFAAFHRPAFRDQPTTRVTGGNQENFDTAFFRLAVRQRSVLARFT